ncbi:MAG: hypothetical protein AB1Z98_20935 [Nannocystaceae bacterium]
MAKKKTSTKKTSSRKTTKKAATAKKTTRKTAKKAATAKKKTTKKASTAKKASTRKTTKKAATAKKTSTRKAAKKTSTRKATKKTPARKTTKKRGARSSKTLDGRSLVDRARECTNLEECRKFIIELGEAIEQSNDWLNEMHDQALSAEQARDLYGEQISDLLEAIDIDRKRISELEAQLKKARRSRSSSSASDAVLRKLTELSTEIQQIRADLKRVASARQPTAERRTKARKAKTADSKSTRKAPQRPASQAVGPFAKYSVLRGAACSLGVGKHGYPPEVCAPAFFPRPVAAEILGTYAQNDYGGLAKWALLTGFPIDDGGSPPRVVQTTATVAKPKSSRKAGSGRKKSGNGRAGGKKASTRASKTSSPSATTRRSGKAAGRNSSQVLDQVLLTIARI